MIENFYRQLTAGDPATLAATFASLASEESHCSSAKRGGDLGQFGCAIPNEGKKCTLVLPAFAQARNYNPSVLLVTDPGNTVANPQLVVVYNKAESQRHENQSVYAGRQKEA